jgi:hypothetical protein
MKVCQVMTEVEPRELMVVKRGWRANDRHGLFAAVRHHKARFKMHGCADVRQLGQIHRTCSDLSFRASQRLCESILSVFAPQVTHATRS